MTLPDQAARDRFASDTGRNFSIIAPAGVGKTTAIAARVLAIARADAQARAEAKNRNAPRPRAQLPRLVVVTYTRKAADELRDRARARLIKDNPSAEVLGLFNEAFFGTIHSFCLELLRRFGPLAGLPTRFAIAPEETALRLALQHDTPDVAVYLPEEARATWRRYGSAAQVWPLVWSWPAGAPPPRVPGRAPTLDFSDVISYQPKIKRADTLENIRRARARLQAWRDAPADARALGVPAAEKGGAEFVALWNAALQPLREWLASAAGFAAAALGDKYAQFKIGRGQLAYGDLTVLVAQLLADPVVGPRIRAEEFSILLDEAQDTDPAQFDVLLGAAQPADAAGLWRAGQGAPPAPGRFSMVGDPQQSIYDRADVRVYGDVRARLRAAGAAEELQFTVTMRCDAAIVSNVNAQFPPLLDGANGQAEFFPLTARPGAGTGRVLRLPIFPDANLAEKPNLDERVRAEAAGLARWLSSAGLAGAGVDDWSQVAVLAPRKKWLGALAAALRAENLPLQLHAENRAGSAEPARAWLGALLGVLADPEDVFELVGVMREIFGVSDDAIYHWRWERENPAAASAVATQALLGKLAQDVAAKPLAEAVARAVSAAQLRERLAAVGGKTAALEALLDQAALAGARGENLPAFARALRRGPAETTEPVARRGEVQLLSNHKAKGLEWPTVVQFGMFLELNEPRNEYPCWVPSAPGQPPICLLDKHQVAPGDVVEDDKLAEVERLLYVAATRPKHTLIFVDASALAKEGRADKSSLAEALGVGAGGRAQAWWQELPEPRGEIIIGNVAAATSPPAASPPAHWPQPEWGAEIFAPAAISAGKFIRRVRPSTLGHQTVALSAERTEPDLAAPPDYPEEQPAAGAAVDYGNWWHNMMEHTPWAAGRAAWATAWEKNCAEAVDPPRAQAEIARFLASPLAARLASPGLEFIVETPFLWAEPGGARAFDGCVDLAAWDGKDSRWLVVDWKTDYVHGDYAAELRRRYAAQVGVYAQALAALTGAPAAAILYSTRAGIIVEL